MTTLRELLTGTLRLLNVVQDGETPSASDLELARDAMNVMVDNWSADKLYIYKSRPFEFAITPGKSSYTLGTGADWNTPRPMNIDMAYIKYTPYVPITPAPTPPVPPPTPGWPDVVLLLPAQTGSVTADMSSFNQSPQYEHNIEQGPGRNGVNSSITTGSDFWAELDYRSYGPAHIVKDGNWTFEFDLFIPAMNSEMTQAIVSMQDYNGGGHKSYVFWYDNGTGFKLYFRFYSNDVNEPDIEIPYTVNMWATMCICQNLELGKIFYYVNGFKIGESTNIFTSSTEQLINLVSAYKPAYEYDMKPGTLLANVRYTLKALRNGTNYTPSVPYPIGSI